MADAVQAPALPLGLGVAGRPRKQPPASLHVPLGDLLQTALGGWKGRKKNYDLCRLRLWDSCRCILSAALRKYNRKRNRSSLQKHRGAGLGTLPRLAASSRPALVAILPLHWSQADGSFEDSPHWGWHLAAPAPIATCSIQLRQGMHRAICSLQKHLQGHQLSQKKVSIPLCAY